MKRRVLTLTQATELTAEHRRWLAALGYLMPMAGADGEGEGGDEGGEGTDEGASAEGEGAEAPPAAGRKPPAGSVASEEDDDDDPSQVRVSKAEFERLRRIAQEQETARKKAEREAKQRNEREKQEQGKWEELLTERDGQLKEIEAERDAARLELDETMRRQRIQSAAVRLGFKDPADAAKFLSEDDTMDDVSTERSLKQLAKAKSYLVNERKSSGAPVNGDGSTLSMDDLRNMSPEEINKRWSEAESTLAASGGS